MSEQAIEGLKFAREARRLGGALSLTELPGLADTLLDNAGEATYRLAGFVDDKGRPGIEVEVQAMLTLRCERCLGALSYGLTNCSRLLLATANEDLPAVESEGMETETVPVASVASIADLVEQQILLALPLAPMHAQGTCALPVEQPEGRLESPFGVLAQLKQKRSDNDH